MGWVTDGPGAVALGPEDRARAVAAVKAQLRVSIGDEDALVATMAEAALGLAERFLGAVTIARALSVRLAPAAGWRALPTRPVRAIEAVRTADGITLPLAGYSVDIDADGGGWVRAEGAVEVAFTAGLADGWDELPAPIRHGAVLLAAHLFEHRGGGHAAPPAAVTALWRPFRRMALMTEARP